MSHLSPLAPRLIYTPRYNIGFFGVERLHPFDSHKFARAWRVLLQEFGSRLKAHNVRPRRPITRDQLLRVHKAEYLAQLRRSHIIATIIELPILRRVPAFALDYAILRPMRWATAGTVLAAHEAMTHGLAFNLSGGYHHASPDDGQGFSVYTDVGLAVEDLRRTGRLGDTDRVAYIDLDAHQGNGVCRTFYHDSRVFIFDMYNQHIFPLDVLARPRIDCPVPLSDNCSEADYLAALQEKLPPFLDALRTPPRLAIYNAGTDPFIDDVLGGLNLSEDGILERDQFVLQQLLDRHIPTLVLPSGGYSKQSYSLIAKTIAWALSYFSNPG